MAERERERREAGAGRCPYCHDAIAATAVSAGDARIECELCRAPHHAECFVELGKCAATGCSGQRARVGEGAGLETPELAGRVAAGDLSIAVAGPRLSLLRAIGLWVSVLAWAGAALAMAGRWDLAIVLPLLGLLLLPIFLPLVIRGRGTPSVRVDTVERPLDPGQSNLMPWTLAPRPHELLREQLGAESAEPVEAPTTALPPKCPSCGGEIEREGDDPVAFCYHCGASLV
jgi:hypothetical protein